MTLLLGRVWIPFVAVLYVAFAALQMSPSARLAYWVIAACPLLFVAWRRTAPSSAAADHAEPGALQASRGAIAAGLLWLSARSGPAGHPAFDAVANLAAGSCTVAALVALARIAPPRGLLTPSKTTRSLDGVVFAGFLWSVATSLPALKALTRDSALRLDPLTVDYATLAAALSSLLLLLAVSARFRWLRSLELGVGDRATGSLVVSVVSLLFAVPMALLNFGAPDRIVPGVLVTASLIQCWIATTADPARIIRWLRALIALLALGAPVALLGSVIAQSHSDYTGLAIVVVAGWCAGVGIFARTVAKPLQPEQSRWLSAIERATQCALEPDPNDALRFALAELSKINPNLPTRTELWCTDPAEAKYVDIAGQLHERAASLPERLTELAANEPELTLRLEVLRTVQVRRPEVRPLVSWFEHQGNFCATLLQSETGTVGVLCVPIGGRKAPLTLEEARALQRLALRIGAILAVSASQSRSRQRELAAIKAREDLQSEFDALRANAAAEHQSFHRITEIWANAVRKFAYAPESRMVLAQVERYARTTLNQVLVVPAGADARGWAAVAHLASPRADKPLLLVESIGESEAFRPWRSVDSDDAHLPLGNLALLEPTAVALQDQQELAHWLPDPSGSASSKLGCILVTRCPLGELVSRRRLDEALARRFGSYETNIPPLCERSEDLRALIFDRVVRFGVSIRTEPFAIDDAVLDELLNYEWPGNETELESVLQLLVQEAAESLIHLDDLESIGFHATRRASSDTPSPPAPKVQRPPQRRTGRRNR